MITAAEPRTHQAQALWISLALHCCGLLLLALVMPLWHPSDGYGFRDEASDCTAPCARVFAIQIQHRARSAATAGMRRIASVLLPVAHPKALTVAAQHEVKTPVIRPRATQTAREQRGTAAEKAQLASTGDAGKNPNVSIVATTTDVDPAASRLQPNTISANPGQGVETPPQTHVTRAVLGPANWGSGFDVPMLRDRALYEEVVAKLPKRGSITITVDDQGRATNVLIDAPGLDAATLDDLRRRLLVAHYAPVERDGIAFDGTLRINAAR